MISTLSIGGLTLGTTASGYLFGSLGGFEFPDVQVDLISRGLYHGASLGNYFYQQRSLVVEGIIFANNTTDFGTKRRALAQATQIYNGLQELTIVTKDGLTLYADVIVGSKIGLPYQKGMAIICDFQLSFVAPNPFLKSADKTQSLDVFTGGGGAIPMTIPFSLGVGGTGATSVTNSGNGQDFPTVVIYGPATNPSIQNSTTGLSLGITYTLSTSTDTITLDFYNHTALYNNTTNVLGYVTGDWWVLEPGTNTLKLSSSSYSSGAGATVTYHDSYIGI